MAIHLTHQKHDTNVRNSFTNFQKVTDFKKDYFLSLAAFTTGISWQWFLALVINFFPYSEKKNVQSYGSTIKSKEFYVSKAA